MSARRTSRVLARLAGPALVCLIAAFLPASSSFAPPATAVEPAPAPSAAADHGPVFTVRVAVTGYSSTADQTDATPYITAANTRVRPGILALSRDLLREYTPGAPFGFGDRVTLAGVGVFRVEDTMAARFTKRADIWFATREEARRWGHRRGLDLSMTLEHGDGSPRITAAASPRLESGLAD